MFSAIFGAHQSYFIGLKSVFSPRKVNVFFLFCAKLYKARFNPSEMGSKYQKSQNPSKRGGECYLASLISYHAVSYLES